ncbi:MAG TPA: hypothetical protein VN039_13440 [Nitrospira sp.]|nr:hypothetical protein [Nitrospira sp.]
MSNRRATSNSMAAELLKALDWVHRTGWPTRGMDTITAMRNFDANKACSGPFTEFEGLALSLWAAFSDRYEDEIAEHLTRIFLVSLESRLCSGDNEEMHAI